MKTSKHNPQIRTSSKALTLVEITAALVITSMLMVAVVSVAAGVSRADKRQQQLHQNASTYAPLRELLTADLLHASAVNPVTDGFEIQTMACLDNLTLDRKHLPVVVEYRLQKIDSRYWLVRYQQSLTGGRNMRELVCCGIATFNILQGGEEQVPDSDPNAGPAVPGNSLTAVVEFDSPDRQPLRVCVLKD